MSRLRLKTFLCQLLKSLFRLSTSRLTGLGLRLSAPPTVRRQAGRDGALLWRKNEVCPNSLVFFMRVNEQEAANEPAGWREDGVMDGRGLKRQPPEGKTSVHTNAHMRVLSICLFKAKLALVNLSCSEHGHECITSIQAVTDRPRVQRGDAWLHRIIIGCREVWETPRAIGADVNHV